MSDYPVTVAIDYQQQQSRLTTFFRGFMAIPHMIWLSLYGLAAYVAIIIAWFAILFTGRYPEGLYTFVARYTRLLTQFSGYFFLVTDVFPPFDGNSGNYPVRVSYAGPLPEYSRVKTFFRSILALPLMLLRYYVIGPLLMLGAIAAWFVILVTGKLPRGLHDLMALGLVYTTRADAYFPMLLTETYPPFVSSGAATGDLQGGESASLPSAPMPAPTPAQAGAPEAPLGQPSSPPPPGGPESPR